MKVIAKAVRLQVGLQRVQERRETAGRIGVKFDEQYGARITVQEIAQARSFGIGLRAVQNVLNWINVNQQMRVAGVVGHPAVQRGAVWSGNVRSELRSIGREGIVHVVKYTAGLSALSALA